MAWQLGPSTRSDSDWVDAESTRHIMRAFKTHAGNIIELVERVTGFSSTERPRSASPAS
jgi:hypothetical protein